MEWFIILSLIDVGGVGGDSAQVLPLAGLGWLGRHRPDKFYRPDS